MKGTKASLADVYIIFVGCAILRLIFKDNFSYLVSCFFLGMGMGIYVGKRGEKK